MSISDEAFDVYYGEETIKDPVESAINTALGFAAVPYFIPTYRRIFLENKRDTSDTKGSKDLSRGEKIGMVSGLAVGIAFTAFEIYAYKQAIFDNKMPAIGMLPIATNGISFAYERFRSRRIEQQRIP